MPNAGNLKRLTPEEAREYGRRGGIASGRARRERRTLRDYAEYLMALPIRDEGVRDGLRDLGIPADRLDNRMRVVAGLLAAACAGNVPAVKELRGILGEDETRARETGGVIEIGAEDKT